MNRATNIYAGNMKRRGSGCQNSRKLKIAPVRLKDGASLSIVLFLVNKMVLISPFINFATRYVQERMQLL